MKRMHTTLFGQVVIALILGIIVGVVWPGFAVELKPFGDGFIKLIKMIIAPLVFCVVVHGICSTSDIRKVGRVGIKALVYFEVVTTFALALGVILAYVFSPGHGMHVDPSSLDGAALSAYTGRTSEATDTVGFIMRIIPSTFVDAFASGDILQVLLIAVMFGFAVALLGERGRPVVNLLDSLTQVFFKLIAFIVKLAPIGVLGAIAFTVGKYGVGTLGQLGMLVALFYITCFIFVAVVLGFILRLAGFNIFKLLRYLREELLVVLGTASSDAVLPQVMRKLELMGVKKSTVGLVIPTGYSFNLDGFSIYLTLAAVFIAQATDTPLSFVDLMTILAVSLLTSKGAHGVPGSAIVILAATLSAIPAIPAIGLVLVLSVDWFMGMARALTNMIGNCVGTVVIGAWERDIDRARAHDVLDGRITVDLDAPDENELESDAPTSGVTPAFAKIGVD
ncbi:C4-dicarboxylate transporter DctA [Allopusillimonas ginsengisoli]|uniref:C4-dicarboxylate transporter DctA n=1 Tax=Allopusillimonas ginsengisoli TaxID=453575 RepID=UPI001022466A|nr:C4-dicarboxylate transporter DctA [Allopusillimonas ginsengisoli]TEA80301.1 C4-dicarboxylate transporter DctA [Allopusillimonas ginsengisoli]